MFMHKQNAFFEKNATANFTVTASIRCSNNVQAERTGPNPSLLRVLHYLQLVRKGIDCPDCCYLREWTILPGI